MFKESCSPYRECREQLILLCKYLLGVLVCICEWDADADAFGKIVANTCMAFVHLNN